MCEQPFSNNVVSIGTISRRREIDLVERNIAISQPPEVVEALNTFKTRLPTSYETLIRAIELVVVNQDFNTQDVIAPIAITYLVDIATEAMTMNEELTEEYIRLTDQLKERFDLEDDDPLMTTLSIIRKTASKSKEKTII